MILLTYGLNIGMLETSVIAANAGNSAQIWRTIGNVMGRETCRPILTKLKTDFLFIEMRFVRLRIST